MRLIHRMCLGIAALALGCGSELPEESAPRCVSPEASELSALEGIYELTHYTLNELSCDVEGPSVLGDFPESFLVVRRSQAAPALVVAGCVDVDACHDEAAGEALFSPDTFACSIGDGSLYGEHVDAGSAAGSECSGAAAAEGFVATESDGSIAVHVKMKAGSYPTPARGCSLRAAEQASKVMSCRTSVLRGSRVASL
ncbi:MAG TPA: hypothetical protein VK524_16565 [Polyangiaceae bacterium]|nr:hypothetical protein [Polyangiaceae bacterium]